MIGHEGPGDWFERRLGPAVVTVVLASALTACSDGFVDEGPVNCVTREGPVGVAPWGLDAATLPSEQAAVERTMSKLAELIDKYDLVFKFLPLEPICLSVLSIDEDRASTAGNVERHMGIDVTLSDDGGYPGDSAMEFLEDLATRAEGQIESQALGRRDDLVYLATAIRIQDEAPGQMHFGFAWGLRDSAFVFVVDTRTPEERANVVRAFAEAARASSKPSG